jgi:hypothetical protein
MAETSQTNTSFETLVAAIKQLDLEQLQDLFEILDDLLFEAEEDDMEPDSQMLASGKATREADRLSDFQAIGAVLANSVE